MYYLVKVLLYHGMILNMKKELLGYTLLNTIVIIILFIIILPLLETVINNKILTSGIIISVFVVYTICIEYYKFKKPKRWMTSGGLGTMGFGLPAAIGVQLANPGKLVVDIAGEASILIVDCLV